MKHVMIDLETLGTTPDSVWLSIAAVQFDPATGENGEVFKANVSLASSQKQGRKISPNTLEWWLKQKPEIMAKMLADGLPLASVLSKFYIWMGEYQIVFPWSNSASFDLGILANSFAEINHPLPWKFYNERCYRTISSLLPLGAGAKDAERAHDPLYDCHYQIENLVRINKALNLQIK